MSMGEQDRVEKRVGRTVLSATGDVDVCLVCYALLPPYQVYSVNRIVPHHEVIAKHMATHDDAEVE